MRGDLFLVLVTIIVSVAIWSYHRGQKPTSTGRTPRKTPKEVRLSVVEIANMRYFDVRDFPRELFVGYVPIDAAKNAVASLAPVAAHVWVLPASVQPLLDELAETAFAILLSRFKDPALGGKATTTFVYVEGWKPSATQSEMAKASGVELLLALPTLVGHDESVATLLDRARQR